MEKAAHRYHGVWVTMVTPFTDGNRIDFRAIPALVEWYIRNGCDGIFTVCQSSEMFFLSPGEKIDLARCVVETVGGRVPVVASGHTADDPDRQVEELSRMGETGVEALILVTNRLAGQEQPGAVAMENARRIYDALPGVTLGMYECPYPYKRLIHDDFLRECRAWERMVFIKDTCCDEATIAGRAAIAAGSHLALFNANSATLAHSLRAGYAGYNGVMANFHPRLYAGLLEAIVTGDEGRAEALGAFITLSAVLEARAYPVSAKYHMRRLGLPVGLWTRCRDADALDDNARLEVESLILLEERVGRLLSRR